MVSELEPSSMASNTQATQATQVFSSQRELTPMEDPRSPFCREFNQKSQPVRNKINRENTRQRKESHAQIGRAHV